MRMPHKWNDLLRSASSMDESCVWICRKKVVVVLLTRHGLNQCEGVRLKVGSGGRGICNGAKTGLLDAW